MDRLAYLKQLIAATPDDPFPRYGVAMEYKSQGRHDEAKAAFAELMSAFPNYVPAYLMAGGNFEALEDLAMARRTYEEGIAVARTAKDAHTVGELESALAALDD